ncbi:MAG: alpha/beta hydrolase [Deltaproteobacteria bacterium]|nr:alpha/beta hydrolase [Deltaproteobacteria bacterium]
MADLVANGVRHHVQRLGSPSAPQTVVFLHGLVMDNLSSFYFTLANPTAAHADVVLYDLRGHGMSERPASGYRVADFVADLAAILDGLAIERPVYLVGNSFGGLVALAFAAAHPARVAGLVLIDAHDGAGDWSAKMSATLALRGEARDSMIAVSFQSWLGRHSERKRTRLATAAQALVEGTTLVADLAAATELDDAALAPIRGPALAIYGEKSDVIDRGRRLAQAIPGCELVVLPGCSHSVIWEATDEVRRLAVGWLAARTPRID